MSTVTLQKINLTIDGQPVTAHAGQTVLEVAQAAGVFIPTLCAHPDLPAFGACRLCVVEIEGVRGHPTSCTTPATDGMKVTTWTPALQELRDGVMELMLSGHPNSCLVCNDREECEKYRPRATKAGSTTRCGFCSNRTGCVVRDLVFDKLPAPNGATNGSTNGAANGAANDGNGNHEGAGHPAAGSLQLPTLYMHHKVERDDPFIDRDHNLCVLCGRCWRICEKIHGQPVISIVRRGRHAKIGTAFGKSWQESGCTFCGACVDICPTGTLADRQARWQSESAGVQRTVCTLCPEMCSLHAVTHEDRLVSTRMAAFDSAARLCALGRFGLTALSNQPARLTRPQIRVSGELLPGTWDDVLGAVADRLRACRGTLLILAGEPETRENRYLLEQLSQLLDAELVWMPAGATAAQLPPTVRVDVQHGRYRAVWLAGDFLLEDDCLEIGYLVVAAPLPPRVMEQADAVLPLSLPLEGSGTVRGADGEIRMLKRIAAPPGLARTGWTVLHDLLVLLGAGRGDGASLPEITSAIGYHDPAPRPLPGDPRDSIEHLPHHYLGYRLADWIPALSALGLPPTPQPAVPEETTGGFHILHKEEIVPNFHRLTIHAPAVARHARPGQFVMLMAHNHSERTPYTLMDWDAAAGTITVVLEETGRSSREIIEKRSGDRLSHVTGPLGTPPVLPEGGTVMLGGGCYGVGAIYPLARACKATGNRVIAVIEACSAYTLYLEEELSAVCDEVILATKDGSRGFKGGVQDIFVQRQAQEPVTQFIAIGCAFMMRITADRTRELGVPLQVALNPIMVDGTGMCGACRLEVSGETKFACVDGPFFDGHGVDWEEVARRRAAFHRAEVRALPQDARSLPPTAGTDGRKSCLSKPRVAAGEPAGESHSGIPHEAMLEVPA